MPKKEPPLQPSHYTNKIRDPSSPGPGACGWGRRKEAGRGAHSTAVPARLGNGEVKRAPSSSPGQRSPPQLFPPLYPEVCSDNCAKTMSQGLKLPPLWVCESFQNAPKCVIAICCFLMSTTCSLLNTLHLISLSAWWLLYPCC